ncbi:AAA family ATPase [Streptomyces sp. NPDC005907]|uniref:MinD/ParA family ATP-binding protein n=1 Tax=Streptomyces sp. NPDC005907 TaxID=3154571 RepID=UPI0033C4D205
MAVPNSLDGLDSLGGLTAPEHLFTWVDVDEHLTRLAMRGEWPAWLIAADGWWESLELITEPGVRPDTVRAWLNETFGGGSAVEIDGSLLLRLDDPRARELVGLQVHIEPSTEGVTGRRLPLLREKHITRGLADRLRRPDDDRFAGDVQLMAFHSFKGGVGRTVHAVAAADAMAREGRNVLLVDADLEAPGITWMHRAQGGQCDFAYEDFLALLQGSQDDDWTAAVDIAARYLPNQQAGRYPGGGRLTLVPTSRRDTLWPARIEPADLLTPSRSTYFLTEALAALGERLGADVVVIDLRAGASELAAPVLLDPRVQRIFVTTISHQSLAGTEQLIRQLGQKAPTVQGVDPAGAVIVTQYREDSHTAQAEEARERLTAALTAALGRAAHHGDGRTNDGTGEVVVEADIDVLVRPVLSRFREELLGLPSQWDSVLEVINGCGISDVLRPLLPVRGPSGHEAAGAAREADIHRLRDSLARTAKGLVYAEGEGLASVDGFLVTDPLRKLLSDHRTEPPIALVVGAKGAGKTFLFAKACAAGRWERFAETAGVDGVQLTLPVVPVLESANLEPGLADPQTLRDNFAEEHTKVGSTIAPSSGQAVRDRLRSGLADLRGDDDLAWRRLWLECLALAAGMWDENSRQSAEDALVFWSPGAPALFVIDGLEDLLQNLDNETKKTALRVLLVDVLGWLRALRGRPYGLVVFVRKDLVTRAVRQNSGQLLARYDRYALSWDDEEALRLALWVCGQAGALPEPVPAHAIRDMGYDDLVQNLIQVWGWKVGSEKSREARSHLWVPAALGDYQGQVQARDVVVFLAEAAKLSLGQDGWEDRVLAPVAMRKALLACSNNKIEATAAENQEVGELLDKLAQAKGVSVPFNLDDVGLDSEEADTLIAFGVLGRGSDGRYSVPEIYRHGLGYTTERRAKVLGN